MSEFRSWESYWKFRQTVREQNRYFRNKDTEEFLNTVLSTIGNRKETLPKGKYFWRAQLGNGWQPIYEEGEHITDIPAPFPRERMKPLLREASEGRANPKGIPLLYLATNKKTAMAEVRPWLGFPISVGLFETVKNLVLINCSVHHDKNPLHLEEPNQEQKEHSVWAHIDRAFSEPMTNNDRLADYVPTQIIAELFKVNGFDGIYYKSFLGEGGHNVVLFDVNVVNLVRLFLFEAKSIAFNFKETANPYYVKESTTNTKTG